MCAAREPLPGGARLSPYGYLYDMARHTGRMGGIVMRRWPRLLPLLLCLLLCTVSAGAMRTHGSVQNQRYDGYEIRHRRNV